VEVEEAGVNTEENQEDSQILRRKVFSQTVHGTAIVRRDYPQSTFGSRRRARITVAGSIPVRMLSQTVVASFCGTKMQRRAKRRQY